MNPSLNRPVKLVATSITELFTTINTMVQPVVKATGMVFVDSHNSDNTLADNQWLVDDYRVKVAVTNLIKNACLHSEGTTGSLSASIEGKKLVVTISDNGKGIPETSYKELIKPFVRGKYTTDGTGMGLAIAKSWIEEMGGSFSYRQLTPGSEFLLVVPIMLADPTFENAELIANRDDAIIQMDKKAILVEDSTTLLKLQTYLLEEHFSTVVGIESGNLALSELDDADLLMTDYHMPGMDGPELISIARARGFTGPIIALTGATSDNEQHALHEAGVTDVILKPLNPRTLNTIIRRYFHNEQTND